GIDAQDHDYEPVRGAAIRLRLDITFPSASTGKPVPLPAPLLVRRNLSGPNRLLGRACPMLVIALEATGRGRHKPASSLSALRVSKPLLNEVAQSPPRAGGIVRNHVGPRFDPAGERTRDAGLLRRGVEAGEFGVAAVET